MIDKQLKAMMDKKGLTLEKLSMLSNVPIETIRNIIYRRARNPRVDTLLALSRTLDVSMESLMESYAYRRIMVRVLSTEAFRPWFMAT